MFRIHYFLPDPEKKFVFIYLSLPLFCLAQFLARSFYMRAFIFIALSAKKGNEKSASKKSMHNLRINQRRRWFYVRCYAEIKSFAEMYNLHFRSESRLSEGLSIVWSQLGASAALFQF